MAVQIINRTPVTLVDGPDVSITEHPNGFAARRPSRPRVTVHLEPWALTIAGGKEDNVRCGLFEKEVLIRHLAERLADPWERAADEQGLAPLHRAITDRVGKQQQRLVALAPEPVQGVQRALFAANQQSHWLAETEAFYRERYLVHDVVTYRAAAVALAYLEDLWPEGRTDPSGLRTRIPPVHEMTRDDVFAALANWRGLFSPTGVPYRSLNRTLMNLPGGISAGLLLALPRVTLLRPITDRLELTALCTRLLIETWNDVARDNQVRILRFATSGQIAQAIERIGERTHRYLSPRSEADIEFALRYLADYRTVHHGSLGGLVTKVIRWHDEVQRRGLEEAAGQAAENGGLDLDTPTARPPIALPTEAGIRFLATVGEVLEEGQRMGHCIENYAAPAVADECFLFHIDHRGESASVEVGCEGSVRQAAGPDNRDNRAARWGARRLRAWVQQ